MSLAAQGVTEAVAGADRGARPISADAWLAAGVVAALGAAAVVAVLMGKQYLLTVLARMIVFSVAALSLNLIMGYGGMVSFGHALYLGIGVYAVGILDHYGIANGWLHLTAALGASAIVALAVGGLSLRVSGVYFIMITLAFAQMAYYLFTGMTVYGGDEGMTLGSRSRFFEAVPLKHPYVFYALCLAVLALYCVLVHRIVNSRFGMVIQGARINERRMLALGYPVYRYRLVAYVLSAAMCAVSGFLLANLNEFASSQYMHWIISGDLIVMIVMGGINSVAGPVIGACVFIILQEVLSAYTDRWQVVLGPILILLVVFAREGIVGLFTPARRQHG